MAHRPGPRFAGPFTGAPTTGNYLYLQSDVGDFVGAGRTDAYTPSNATIGVLAFGGRLTVSGGEWTGVLQTMNSIGELRAGSYPDVRRWPFHNPARGGLDWTDARGCNKVRGWFAIDKVTYVDNAITSVELRFE